jgi:hypothetical protein
VKPVKFVTKPNLVLNVATINGWYWPAENVSLGWFRTSMSALASLLHFGSATQMKDAVKELQGIEGSLRRMIQKWEKS